MWQGIFFYYYWMDTLTFDQHVIFSEFLNGFSLAWYSILKNSDVLIMMQISKSYSHVNCNVGKWTCLMSGGKEISWVQWVCERNPGASNRVGLK